MTTNYKPGQVPDCPHCGKPFDGPVEDYVVQGPSGKLNQPYFDECGWCDGEFAVIKRSEDAYEVDEA